jgi:hypothetical protein
LAYHSNTVRSCYPFANEVFSQLADKLDRTKAQVADEALQELEERVFWREVQEAFAKGEPEDLRAERELWDCTANDGLAGDRW